VYDPIQIQAWESGDQRLLYQPGEPVRVNKERFSAVFDSYKQIKNPWD
jgi:hypothetical protein